MISSLPLFQAPQIERHLSWEIPCSLGSVGERGELPAALGWRHTLASSSPQRSPQALLSPFSFSLWLPGLCSGSWLWITFLTSLFLLPFPGCSVFYFTFLCRAVSLCPESLFGISQMFPKIVCKSGGCFCGGGFGLCHWRTDDLVARILPPQRQ